MATAPPQSGRVPMSGEGLRRYFRQLFTGEHEVTPQEGDQLTVTTASGPQSVRVNDVTNIGAHQHHDGRRTERFSVILEGGLEVVLDDTSYEFTSGTRHFPMNVRHFGPSDGGPQLYEGVLEVDDASNTSVSTPQDQVTQRGVPGEGPIVASR